VKALLKGLALIPEIPREVRAGIENDFPSGNPQELYNKVLKIDQTAAEKIKINDRQKLIRTLEVYEFTGKPISYFWQQQKEKNLFRVLNIYLTDDRESIYQRINSRIDKMLEKGLLKEIEGLLGRFESTDPGMNSVGYKEFIPFFHNEDDLENCIEEAKKDTRNLAKRQLTWYKKIDFDLTLKHFDINISYVITKINSFLI
jgi:tRNA dimethylallyltransferase